ncbi:hypothetical protein Tco_0660195 [Tanacetum coccineum]
MENEYHPVFGNLATINGFEKVFTKSPINGFELHTKAVCNGEPDSFLAVSHGYNGEIEAKGTLKKSCLPPRWRLLMGQIIQCLGGKTGGLDQISNKDATILYCLANGVQVDYAKIIWEDLIHKLNKKTMEKIIPYPRFISLLPEHMAPKYDKEELTINPHSGLQCSQLKTEAKPT